jgi:hypothetical protein
MELLERMRDFFNFSRRMFLPHSAAQQVPPTWQLVAYDTGSCVPRQRDGHSCGVCVCVNAWLLVRGRRLAYACELGMPQWRMWMFTILLGACIEDPHVERMVRGSEL